MPRRTLARSRSRASTTTEPCRPAPAGSVPWLSGRHRKWVLTGLAGIAVVLALVGIGVWVPESPARLQARAESAARAGDWTTALRSWRALNAKAAARGATHLAEARACLALGRAAQAEQSLRRAIAADPADPEPWQLLLEILRVEDRTLEAREVGGQASTQARPEARRALLRDWTLALLADLPDELVRTTLNQWIQADDGDVDARVALAERIAAQPRAADPDRAARLAELEALLADHPGHLGARAAMASAWADAGEPDRGRAVLEGWPAAQHDARYWRLLGRWELDYDHRPEQAVAAFRKALAVLPQDWRSWYRLARALRMLGRDAEAGQAAETVGRIREVLDPVTLGPRLEADFQHLDDAAALRDLADLADHVGLASLADAWRAWE